MTYVKGTFPDLPGNSLEKKLSTACLASIEYFSGEDSLDKTVKIFRTTRKEGEKGRGVQEYVVITIFEDGRASVPKKYDSCPYHKQQAKEELSKYLPKEIIQAEFGQISREDKNLPRSFVGNYSPDGKIHLTYYFSDGTMRQGETVKNDLPRISLLKESQESVLERISDDPSKNPIMFPSQEDALLPK